MFRTKFEDQSYVNLLARSQHFTMSLPNALSHNLVLPTLPGTTFHPLLIMVTITNFLVVRSVGRGHNCFYKITEIGIVKIKSERNSFVFWNNTIGINMLIDTRKLTCRFVRYNGVELVGKVVRSFLSSSECISWSYSLSASGNYNWSSSDTNLPPVTPSCASSQKVEDPINMKAKGYTLYTHEEQFIVILYMNV